MNYRSEMDRLKGKQSVYIDELKKYEDKIESLGKLSEQLEIAKSLILSTASQLQNNVKFRIEDVVNTALGGVFGPKYTFVIRFEPKGGRTSATLALCAGGKDIDPLRSNGGGLVDVLTFALRVAIIIISKAPRILILDEPFKHVSADLRPATYEMLQLLGTKVGIQVVACTHDPALVDVADRVIQVSIRDGISKVVY